MEIVKSKELGVDHWHHVESMLRSGVSTITAAIVILSCNLEIIFILHILSIGDSRLHGFHHDSLLLPSDPSNLSVSCLLPEFVQLDLTLIHPVSFKRIRSFDRLEDESVFEFLGVLRPITRVSLQVHVLLESHFNHSTVSLALGSVDANCNLYSLICAIDWLVKARLQDDLSFIYTTAASNFMTVHCLR